MHTRHPRGTEEADPMILETSRIRVPAESDQATIVRQFVRLACHRYGCDAVADNVLQVTAELLSNALGHAPHSPDDTLEVGIVPTQRGVRVEVSDSSPTGADEATDGAPGAVTAPPAIGLQDERQGLRIVASLAQDWGIEEVGSGTTLWAEMDSSP
jgi:anti-sigma regulatory factor (Ser/Thr protein kinase)